MTTTTRQTSSLKLGPGKSRLTRVTNNKISNSTRTRTKTGENSYITQTAGPKGFTTTSTSKSGGITRSVTTRSNHSAPKSPKTSSRRSSSRSSKSSSGDASGALGLLMLIGLFTGIWFILKSLFSWATTSKDVTVTPESAPAIEANADPLLLK